LITGGGSGLGRAIAVRFRAEGARVMIADVDGSAQEVATELGAAFVHADVTDPNAVAAAVAACSNTYGRLDVMVNNAGIGADFVKLHDRAVEDWHKIIEVDQNGVFYGMKFALAQMVRQTAGGVVINISSIAGLSGFGNLTPYTAAKAAVVHMTRCAALEYGPCGIRVNGVAPTVVMTPLIERALAADPNANVTRAAYESLNPLPGMPGPEDVAAAVAFLASDDARYITGVMLPVDGGFTAK
jgi:meso-butanediol dehydrogenase/(S,S)-butanediol dehydrogenase/diacetyl reductase